MGIELLTRGRRQSLSNGSEDAVSFSPYWVFPDSAKIERHVLPYPPSRDRTRYDQLKVDLATYRLAFGQPRQEDMLELLKRRGVQAAGEPLDLRPPVIG